MAELRGSYVIASAVLVGAAMVALAVWLGLRSIACAQNPTNGSARADATNPGTPASAVATPPPAPTPALDASSAARDESNRLIERVQDALAAQQPAYAETCWKRLPKADGPDLGASFEVELSFAADGRETRRAFREVSGRPALVACVKALSVPKLSIAPPGKPITAKGALTIP